MRVSSTHSCILPVKVHTIQVVFGHHIGHGPGQCLSISVTGRGVAEALVRVGVVGEGPAAHGHDAFDPLQLDESIELFLVLAGVECKIGLDINKGVVDVGVAVAGGHDVLLRHLGHVHVEAAAVKVPRFKIGDPPGLAAGLRRVQVESAVGHAAVASSLGRPWTALFDRRRDTKVGAQTAVAPDIAAHVQRTGVQVGDCRPVVWPLGAGNGGPAQGASVGGG